MEFGSVYAFQYKPEDKNADVPIVTYDYAQLGEKVEICKSKEIYCKCGVHISDLSKKNVTFTEKIEWKCEFCYNFNDLTEYGKEMVEKLINNGNQVTYEIEAVDVMEKDEVENKEKTGVKRIVIVLDVSGSMRMRIEERHITLLEAVKQMAKKAIEKEFKEHPENIVTLITFSTEVKYFSDFTKPVSRNGNIMNKDCWKKFVLEQPAPLPIKDTFEKINKSLDDLYFEEYTALGNGLLAGVYVASEVPGSRVVLLTDGYANIGLGKNLEESFFSEVGQLAKDNGVMIDLLSVKGCNCKIAAIGHCALMTEGDIRAFDPKNKNANDFADLLTISQLATNVQLKCFTNKRCRMIDAIDEEERTAIREQGNVTALTVDTFEFEIIDGEDEKEELPFQLQIKYRTNNGAIYKRIISRSQKITKDPEIHQRVGNIHPNQQRMHFSNKMKQCMSRGSRQIKTTETGSITRNNNEIGGISRLLGEDDEPMYLASDPQYLDMIKVARTSNKEDEENVPTNTKKDDEDKPL
ncbi:hypothetical protein SNEBB_004098 [Seison nebaliae]|nr:hypothetical protein SNEBB_004098 [Seison nebaliae]